MDLRFLIFLFGRLCGPGQPYNRYKVSWSGDTNAIPVWIMATSRPLAVILAAFFWLVQVLATNHFVGIAASNSMGGTSTYTCRTQQQVTSSTSGMIVWFLHTLNSGTTLRIPRKPMGFGQSALSALIAMLWTGRLLLLKPRD